MLQEIFEQPDTINRAMNYGSRLQTISNKITSVKLGGLEQYKDFIKPSKNLVVVACGTSFFASSFVSNLVRKLGTFNTVIFFIYQIIGSNCKRMWIYWRLYPKRKSCDAVCKSIRWNLWCTKASNSLAFYFIAWNFQKQRCFMYRSYKQSRINNGKERFMWCFCEWRKRDKCCKYKSFFRSGYCTHFMFTILLSNKARK